MSGILTKIGHTPSPPPCYHFCLRTKIVSKPPLQQVAVQLSAYTTQISNFSLQLVQSAEEIVENGGLVCAAPVVELYFLQNGKYDTSKWIVERFIE